MTQFNQSVNKNTIIYIIPSKCKLLTYNNQHLQAALNKTCSTLLVKHVGLLLFDFQHHLNDLF